ncbi:GNAT family N-acetyltransferase [Prauserella oleivorans]|uniref:GNAT family N-acetyltransferase n=1 Tax=Prauserella oleivorans TaxID=1478153 RepID=A0ABW5WF39_9PSEU
MAPALPDLRTERLLLRRLGVEDLPAVVEIQTDPRTHPYDPPPESTARVRMQFVLWQRHWVEHRFGYLAVVEVETGRIVGLGGVQFKDLEDEPVLNLYYRFRPEVWGKGYAPEMAKAVLAWAERAIPERPVVIVTNVDNEPACRVAEKLGFVEYRQADYDGAPARFFRNRPR